LDRIGESGPPCGVPSSVGSSRPPIITPDVRNLRISFSTRLSLIRVASRARRRSWLTRSKNFERSISTTYLNPARTYSRY
jgi:hypothetical protein